MEALSERDLLSPGYTWGELAQILRTAVEGDLNAQASSLLHRRACWRADAPGSIFCCMPLCLRVCACGSKGLQVQQFCTGASLSGSSSGLRRPDSR